jgi:hypothetical protein
VTEETAKRVWTAVDLEYSAEECNYRLIFGKPARLVEHEKTFGRTRQTAWFESGSIFGLDLWEGALIANAAGERRTRTRERACFVLQAGAPGDELSRVKQVRPGARALISTHGVRRSKFLLGWLAELAQQCDPCALDAEFYLLKSLPVSVLVPEREPPSAIGFPRRVAAH